MELKSVYPVKINLLPHQYITKRTPDWVRLFFIVILILLSFLSYFFTLISMSKLHLWAVI